jgi:3-hydroxyacyl-CoA dehydrogenase
LEIPGIRQPFAEDRLCELGRYGQKTGAGWYKYDDQRRAMPDSLVAEHIAKWVAEAGIAQRQMSATEIVDRCLYALVNEGARILEEGYALRASDIDIIYINGYGFPAHRGGPMWYADTVGLKQVYERVSEFQRQHGEIWQPAPLLKRLAEQGKTFAEFNRDQVATA